MKLKKYNLINYRFEVCTIGNELTGTFTLKHKKKDRLLYIKTEEPKDFKKIRKHYQDKF